MPEIETPYVPAQFRLDEGREGLPVSKMRTFDTGATRNTDVAKLDYEGFLSPVVLRKYAEYMHTHRKQADGTLRSADNWTKGIPKEVYLKSLIRHLMDVWLIQRGHAAISPETGEEVPLEEALCAVLFNTQGLLFEILKGSDAH